MARTTTRVTNFVHDRGHRTTTSVLGALAHVWMLIASTDALIVARRCPDETSSILASLSLCMGFTGMALMTMCLAFYKIPTQWEPETQEDSLRLKIRHFTFKGICCASITGLDFYLSVKMKPHHFQVSCAATVSWILTVAALSASARDLYLTHLELDHRRRRRVADHPINHDLLPHIANVKRQDSWVQ